MNKKVLIAGLLIFFIVGVIFFLINRSPNSSNASLDIKNLKANGLNHEDTLGVYTFLYPRDYRLDVQTESNLTRLIKAGPSQQGLTEINDGIIMVFEPIELQGKKLDEVVDADIEEKKVIDTSNIIQAKTVTTINDNSGFYYVTSAPGRFMHIYLQKNAESTHAVKITYSVNDPQLRGYQNEIDVILSSLELLK